MSWLLFSWYRAHKLELGIQDVLMGTYFDQVDKLLLHDYYLYNRSSKKLRELLRFHDLAKDGIEFNVSGIKPMKAGSTHDIARKV